ncbi:MAG: hypothetical protein Q4F67_12245, partial [Propionibacteriaceae bacterium]|nr:hypothetical protein [Propionibacteriaceae bacterium]
MTNFTEMVAAGIAPDGSMRYSGYRKGAWLPWGNLGGGLTSMPTLAAPDRGGYIDYLALGLDDDLWRRHQIGGLG